MRHHTAVELVDRLVALGLLARPRDRVDRRRVSLRLTARGQRRLDRLAAVHRQQLHRLRPQLAALLRVLDGPAASRRRRRRGSGPGEAGPVLS